MAGIVATSERQAAQIGAFVLRDGGNAVDAAVATAAALTVTEPTSNGLGGDCFALIWDDGVHALAANGAAPLGLDVASIQSRYRQMPLTGWLPVTVPGQVSGWAALLERLGTRPLSELLAPAIRLATDGFEVGPITAAAWARSEASFGCYDGWRRTFTPIPAAGERFANPDLGISLQTIARGGAEAFYGELASTIAQYARQTGGLLREEDFKGQQARWVEPLMIGVGDLSVYGMTAPTQGVVALEALGIVDGLPQGEHYEIEAIKLAFADAYASVCDPEHLRMDPSQLLSERYLSRRRSLIGGRAGPSPAPPGIDGGTVLLCVSDGRQFVSFIQSNFHGFGSGIVVPGTGIALQNRGAGFSLEPGHANLAAPGKRPFHTILPGLMSDSAGVFGAFGCMGGQMQPQGHLQLIRGLAMGLSPQAAIDRPRWRWMDSGEVALEDGFDAGLRDDLRGRGHSVLWDQPATLFGGAQMILRDGRAGSDRRKDGAVVRI